MEGEWRAGAGGLRAEGQSGDILPSIVPFVACGDLSGYVAPAGSLGYPDADKSYPIEEEEEEEGKKSSGSSLAVASVTDRTKTCGADGEGDTKQDTVLKKKEYVAPVAPSIKSPYETSMEKAKEARRAKAALQSC